jgi:hypothetical protein
MNLQTEVYISIDGANFSKVDLAKNESISMKFVLKDTTDLSKIFSPFSLSFTFPGTLHNQRIFGFVGNTKVYKTKTDSIFACKIYSNGLLSQTGKLNLTEVREEMGKVKSFTANFTTTMLSLQARMGEDLINDLPLIPATINWLPNDVYTSISSIKNIDDVGYGVPSKYYVPLISNTRIFQRNPNFEENFLDNVIYKVGNDPNGTQLLKADELSPAVQFRTIIDLIIKKYNLDIEMPLASAAEYNDLFVYCNSEKTTITEPMGYDIINQFTDLVRYRAKNPSHIPNPQKYYISADLTTNLFSIYSPPTADADYNKEVKFTVSLFTVTSTKGTETPEANFVLELENGAIFQQITSTLSGGNLEATFVIKDADFVANYFKFKIKVAPKSPIIWSSSDTKIEYGYYDAKYGPFNLSSYGDYRQSSVLNNNSATMGGTKIDLFKSIPKTKCFDFLFSFFKTFNISVFDASPNNDKLFWLTPKDLLINNQEFSKKEVDYTPYISSRSVQKVVAADYNYYNFKHLTSKYKSNVDYKLARGYEFGQTTYPTIKPTTDLKEFKVETTFSILEALPIAGMADEFTSYGFNSDAPEVLSGGEKRYKPNYDELTIFFGTELRGLQGDKVLGFQRTTPSNVLRCDPLYSYIKTSPIHTNGFSLGFGLIQESIERSLYYDFYKRQTDRLLSPNTLKQTFELELPASELVLNYATTTAGQGLVPDGFRLQNEIILQEERFSLIDATIDITTGKAKMNLLNF